MTVGMPASLRNARLDAITPAASATAPSQSRSSTGDLMPPQGYVLAFGAGLPLGWNYRRSLQGQTTISMWGREHPIVTAAALVAFNAWIWPHLYKETR